MKFLNIFLLVIILSNSNKVSGQLYIGSNTTFYLGSDGNIVSGGDIVLQSHITGTGLFVLNGTTTQTINGNGFTISNLAIDNPANATLSSNLSITSSLIFGQGKISLNQYNATLGNNINIVAARDSAFLETNGTGKVVKEITNNITNYELPIGIGTIYLPAFIDANGTFTNATVALQVKDATNNNYAKKHIRSTDYSNQYWTIEQSGIAGNLRVKGHYASSFTGLETDMKAMFHDGTNWSMTNVNIDNNADTIGTLVNGNGELYAMNKYVYTGAKTYLQGAFNGTNLNDGLRSPALLIPTIDPYRATPLTASFAHVNNSIPEVVGTNVFATQTVTDSNVVDWVFLELRSNSTPSTVLCTRSALILRNGTIVDIDRSPNLYFKNVDSGNYHLAVRHRNHIGVRTLDAITVGLNATTPINLTLNTNAFASRMANLGTGKYGLYSANANDDAIVKMTGLSANNNDYIKLLNTLGSSTNSLTNQYSKQDLNMDKNIKMTGLSASNNDYIRLLNTIGSSTSNISQPAY